MRVREAELGEAGEDEQPAEGEERRVDGHQGETHASSGRHHAPEPEGVNSRPDVPEHAHASSAVGSATTSCYGPWMSRYMALASLMALVGCNAVRTDEVDRFGLVWSAYRVHWKHYESERLTLTNVTGYCRKLQRMEERKQAVFDEQDDDADCGDLEEAKIAYYEAGHDIFHEGTRILEVDVADEFDDDDYDFDKDWIVGELTYYDSDEFLTAIEDFDARGDIEDDCDVDFDWDADFYDVDEGELNVNRLADEGVMSGDFSLELTDDDGDDAGEVQGRFRASYCEVDDAESD